MSDIRDSKQYTIAKLADGNCWMTSNLRLGDTSAITLTDATTDLATNTSFVLPASSNYVPANTNVAYMYSPGNSYIDESGTVVNTGTPSRYSQYLGNYYNWYASTAGAGTYEKTSGDVATSICPKNWKLPSLQDGGEYRILSDTYAADSFIRIFQPTLSGYYGNGAQGQGLYEINGQARNATSTAISDIGQGVFYAMQWGEAYVFGGAYKSTGIPVRCLAR